MSEQRQLLDEMLTQGDVCVKELAPQIVALLDTEQVSLLAVEGAIFAAVLRLGAGWLGLVLSLHAASLAKEAGTRLPCECGAMMRWVSTRSKTILSLLGKVSYKRVYYHCKNCQKGRALGDGAWGLEHTRTTRGVAQLAAYLAAQVGFVQTAKQICRTLYWPEEWLSGKQVQRLAEPLGKRLWDMEAGRVGEWWKAMTGARSGAGAEPKDLVGEEELAEEEPAEKGERLYVEMDGTMVRHRGSEGKGSDVWREVKVGAVFVGEMGRRVSKLGEPLVEPLGEPLGDATKAQGQEVRERIDRPKGKISYVVGRMAAEGFGVRVYAEAIRRGVLRAGEVVILGDGAHWIWELAKEHFPGAVEVLDFWHASEWVWKVAQATWGEGSEKAKRWAEEEIESHLTKGDPAGLIKAIDALPKVAPPPWASKSIPEQAMEYFHNNAGRMNYPAYRARGIEIGSGAVESAAKLVVGQRCKGPGMRWSGEGVEAVLELRTSVLNERYDAALAALPKVA